MQLLFTFEGQHCLLPPCLHDSGKTTLLDVLASRKTGGETKGAITLNGFKKDTRSFTRVAGYVEQVCVCAHVCLCAHEVSHILSSAAGVSGLASGTVANFDLTE